MPLCDCHCGKLCPFGKTGMATRCELADVAAKLGCDLGDVKGRLTQWQLEEEPRAAARFRATFPDGVRITLVKADRPE